MDRETKTIKTSNGHEVILKAYLTGREMNDVMRVYLADSNVSKDNTSIKGVAFILAEEIALKHLVISVDKVEENASEKVMDLPAKDYADVISAVYEIADFKGFAEKKRI